MADTTGGDFKVRVLEDGVQVLAKQFDDLTPLMERIGAFMVKVCQIAFLNQSFNGQKWDPKVAGPLAPSIMGSVQDLTDGPSIARSRYETRALVNTGALRRSIRARASAKTVRVSSDLPYAQLHNDGGDSSLPVTAAVKQNLATFLRSHKSLRPHLGFLFSRDEVSTTVPARPFLGPTDNTREQVERIVAEYLGAPRG